MSDSEPVLEQTSEPSAIKNAGFVDQEHYKIELAKYYSGHNENSKKMEWTGERIFSVIKLIDDFNLAKIQGKRPTNKQYHHANKYDVMMVGDEKVLIVKRKSHTDPVVQIIPSTEYYQLILESHIATDHGRRDKIVNVLRNKYLIPIFAITIFLKLCKTCLLKKSIPKRGNFVKPLKSDNLNKRGHPDSMDLQSSPDNKHKQHKEWLWQYQDLSKYCYLRPLRCEEYKEIAIENVADSNMSNTNTTNTNEMVVEVKMEPTNSNDIDIQEHCLSPPHSIDTDENSRKRIKVEYTGNSNLYDNLEMGEAVNEINRNIANIFKAVNGKDEYDTFGNYIATALRSLPPDAAIMAKTELQSYPSLEQERLQVDRLGLAKANS